MSTGFDHNPGGTAHVTCDRCRARVSQYVPEAGSEFAPAARLFHASCVRDGWTFWGSRSLRTYCPDCKPSPGHRMQDLTGIYGQEKR